jgi:seryl-tRNA synthetase
VCDGYLRHRIRHQHFGIDAKISEAETQIALIQSQIDALEAENADLIKKIAAASIDDAATYRQQYNANKDKITSLKSEKSNWEQQLSQYQQAKSDAIEGESVQTDDYYRIPAIMQDCKTAYNLSWNGSGAWEGNTFVRTASMPNINGVITFKATVSIARKPKYFLGIKIHRAIVQIAWSLSTEYSDTQVVAVVNLDPSKSDEEKAAEVNAKISEVAREYPSCEVRL